MRLFYFILGLSIPLLIAAAPQIGSRFKNAYEIEKEFLNVYQAMDNNKFRIETSTPSMDFMGEGQPIWVYSNNTLFLMTKLKNSRWQANFTRF